MTKKCGQVSPYVATLARIVERMPLVSVGTRCCVRPRRVCVGVCIYCFSIIFMPSSTACMLSGIMEW